MTEDYAEIMSDPPGGSAHGSRAGDSRTDEGRTRKHRSRPLAESALQVEQLDGYSILDPSRLHDAGMTAHRGDLDVDAYIDPAEIQAAVEESLGFTYEEVSSAYKQGPTSAAVRQLRDKIDSRLLALSRARGNMTVLANALGLSEKTVDRALARGRTVEIRPIVANPAVRRRVVSFMTGLPGAKPRRRRHVGCPSHMLPREEYRYSTINLSDAEYARGARHAS